MILRDDIEKILNLSSLFLLSIEDSVKKFDITLKDSYSSLLAHPLEKFVYSILKKKYKSVTHDGKPGKFDIMIHDKDYELEIKTTQSLKYLQADVNTWKDNQKKNFLFFIRNPEDTASWLVILFEDISKEMFGQDGVASKKSKGKASLKKWKAWDHSTILWGDVKTFNRKDKKCFSPVFEKISSNDVNTKEILKYYIQ